MTYPSSQKPLLLLDTPFYSIFKDHLYFELNQKWSEDQLVLYEYVCYIQDEFLNNYLEKGDIHKDLSFKSDGNLEIKYSSSMEF